MKENTILLFVLVIACLKSVISYTLDKCYCYDEFDSTLKAKLATFQANADDFKYLGVMPMMGNSYYPCTCSDVTRVQVSLNFTEQWVYDSSGSPNGLKEVVQNVTDALIALQPSLSNTVKDKIQGWSVIPKGRSTSSAIPLLILEADILLKGEKPGNINQVRNTILSKTTDPNDATKYHLEGVGELELASDSFKLVECDGVPTNVSENGEREWTENVLAGVRATYSCDVRYYIEDPSLAYSECDHVTLKWTVPSFSLTCKKGCQSDPPSPPFYSKLSDWDKSKRDEDYKAKYTCLNTYRSYDGKDGYSTCKNGNWTVIPKSYGCTKIKCPEAIPQVPAYAQSTYHPDNRDISDSIIYSCKQGYRNEMGEGVTVTVYCTSEGNWTPLTKKFACVNKKSKAKRVKKVRKAGDEPNLWLLVTVPCIAGLILVIVFILCCTRTDSPLFICCNSHIPKRQQF